MKKPTSPLTRSVRMLLLLVTMLVLFAIYVALYEALHITKAILETHNSLTYTYTLALLPVAAIAVITGGFAIYHRRALGQGTTQIMAVLAVSFVVMAVLFLWIDSTIYFKDW